jgi:hypothetical protein
MTSRSALLSASFLALAALVTAGGSPPAQALTMKECSTKYKAAQAAGTLGSTTWSEFRRAQCGADASSAATPAAKTPPAGRTVFPNAVSPKYSTETPGKARMHTCLDQYHANKATNGNGGLAWIQKGGGYYSECNRRLKG